MSKTTTAGAVFVLLSDGHDAKQSIVYPDIYGPFESEDAAEQFIAQHPRFEPGLGNIVPIDGGYAAAHIVSARTAEDPDTVLEYWTDPDSILEQ